jgi:alpha/beta superfamily hydrolase
MFASIADPKKLIFIEAADHFFAGRLRELRETIESWVEELLTPRASF